MIEKVEPRKERKGFTLYRNQDGVYFWLPSDVEVK